MSYRLSVDVGGTFTDVVMFDDTKKKVYATKVSSTPKDYSIGIENGIRKICKSLNITLDQISYFIHGTTVATNALLERKGAKTALITTEGFRDILEIARQNRPDLYDFWAKRPESPIPRYLVFEVPERTLAGGIIAKEVDIEKALEIVEKIKNMNIESIAICFINSYANSFNELKMKEILKKEMPKLHICTSAETLPEIKEYERFSTTAVNAYLMPRVKDYINNLDRKREKMGINSGVHIMQSNGGIMSAFAAGERSVHTVFSGPAGGVLASIQMAKLLKEENVITIDIGGTSSDLALIENYKTRFTTDAQLGGFPIMVPMIEMHTIGAGGGSIAWLDEGGIIHVGPQSAGAYPGPACYGYGDEPTVTDANLILGYLNPKNFLGGEMKIYKEKSADAIGKRIASFTKLSIDDAARGILRIINVNMCGGINVISTQKGYDLREFSLMAFGGAGSLHAASLLDELNLKKAIIPVSPGNFSAIGCQLAKVRYDYVYTTVTPASKITVKEYCKMFDEMKKEAFTDMEREGFKANEIVFEATSDMRYAGQSWELSVPVKAEVATTQDFISFVKGFNDLHKRTYGYIMEDEEVVFVNLRLSAYGMVPALEFPKATSLTAEIDPKAIKEKRNLSFGSKYFESMVYNREYLRPGNKIMGPALIEEYASTTPIPPNYTAEIDMFMNIVISRVL